MASKLTDFPAGGCAVFASAAAGPLAAERRFPLAIAQHLKQHLKQRGYIRKSRDANIRARQ
jgi:hypothetical protein